MTYILKHPRFCVFDDWCPNTPEYDYDDLKNFKSGDIVYVIVQNKENKNFSIDTTKLIQKYNNDFDNSWFIDKYNPGFAVDFGETLYSSFEEARAVLVQYYKFPKEWKEILSMSEQELKP